MSPKPTASDDYAVEASYSDPELYDLVYSNYDADREFYLAAARHAQGPVLEAACGTGRLLIPILQAGVDIDGFDRSEPMLERLRTKAKALGLAPNVRAGDLRDVTMPRRYKLVIIPFRAFMHLHETADQIRALRVLRDHLDPGGAVIWNQFFLSYAFMAERVGQRKLEMEFPHPEDGRRVAVWDESRYDLVGQRVTVEREVHIAHPGQEPDIRRYGFTLRWTFRYEMELLLRAAGFTRFEVRGGFDGRPLVHETDEMVWTAWKD
jgi:SAM-dependent methyltransferase